MNTSTTVQTQGLTKAFWVIWGIELWERFGFYGVQAILALYFVQQLGYSESESFYECHPEARKPDLTDIRTLSP